MSQSLYESQIICSSAEYFFCVECRGIKAHAFRLYRATLRNDDIIMQIIKYIYAAESYLKKTKSKEKFVDLVLRLF